MVDLRRNSRPRDYFSRREQGRLLLLVMAFGLAMILFNEARKPERWQRFFPNARTEQPRAPAAPKENVDRHQSIAVGKAAGPSVDPRAPAGEAPPETPRARSADSSSAPRELMRLSGIDDARWAGLQDNRPWSGPENETLQTILLRLAGLPPADVEGWTAGPLDVKRLAADPDAFQGKLFELRGRVRSIAPVKPSADVARRFGSEPYYRAEMTLDDANQPVVVFTRLAPEAWRRGGPIDQPGGAWGMFLKLEPDGAAASCPAFAAPRLAAYPLDEPLGRLGMDVGLLDDLADRRPLSSRERECFYQALAAAGRAKPGQLLKEAQQRLAKHNEEYDSVVPLFNDPAHQRGRLVALYGMARRAILVRVDDPDVRRRLGIDHYYELDLYTPDSQGNPLVFCVRRLPKNMPTGAGMDYAQPVTVAGFFLKSWAYPSGLSRQSADEGRPAPLQLAPLLIGREAFWHKTDQPRAVPIWHAAGGGALALLLLGIWLWLWRRGRAARRAQRARRQAGQLPQEL